MILREVFDRLRRNGEILLLIIADAVRASVERLVDWMNRFGGSSPYKLGLVELGLYALPDGRHLIFPKTLLRTREASRHVITVNVRGNEKDAISVEVSTPNQPTENRKIGAAGIPLTQERIRRMWHKWLRNSAQP